VQKGSAVDGLVIYGLAWHRRPSGVWAPSELTGSPRVRVALDGDRSGQGPVAILNQLPASVEQFGVFVDEAALGLRVSTLPSLEALVAQIGFEPAVAGLANVAIWVDDLPFDAAAQMNLAREIFSVDWIAERIGEFLAPRDRAVVVAEQHLVALSRLLVLHAREATVQDFDEAETFRIERALLGMSALSEAHPLSDTAPPTDWLPFLVQNGAFNGKEPFLEAHARLMALFAIADSDDARPRKDYCDLDALAKEATGLSLRQQMAAGVAAMSGTGALSEGRPAPGAAYLSADFFDQVAERLELGATGATAIRDVLSAERAWYAEAFRSIESSIGLDARQAAAGYNRVPFDSRPFLRLADGRFLLWSPRTIISWLTDGFYYRALDAARGAGRREQFLTFWGYLVEQYARQLLEEVYPEPRPVGSGRVYGEQVYGSRRRRRRTPDIAVEFGTDVVLIEVFSGRLSLEARVGGRPAKIAEGVTKMVAAKGSQLSRRIDDLLAGEFSYPEVDLAHVRRVWPIVVTGPGLLMTEVLSDEIDARMEGAFEQARVQPLTILDLADLEQLVGLVEAGWAIPDLLARKTGAYRRLDWRRMVADDPALPDARGSHVVERWYDAWRAMIVDFGWDPARLDQERPSAAAA
jgi:hypothetical protein